MGPIEACVKNPVKVSVGTLLLVLFGAVGLMRLPMQLIPQVETPTISVETRWPGASPQEVEREITQEQEEQLKSVEGVTRMSSESSDSNSRITLEFEVGTNMEKALLKVNSRLQQVREYPIEADQPVLSTSSASDRPIAFFVLSPSRPTADAVAKAIVDHPELKEELDYVARASQPGLMIYRLKLLIEDHPELADLLPKYPDISTLLRFTEDNIEARLERVQGVSNVNINGGQEDELRVIVDPERLAARGLTLDTVRNVLERQNLDVSGGDYSEGKRRYVVRTLSRYGNPGEIADQLIAIQGGVPVYVRDVAEVTLGFKKLAGVVRRYGEASISVNAIRESNANVIEVMKGLQEAVAELNRDLLKAKNLELVQVYDETEYINSAVRLVNENIIVGGALTMLTLLLFLHLNVRTIVFGPVILATALAALWIHPAIFGISLLIVLVIGLWYARGALVIGVAIPVSIVGTFLALDILGRSLNVISLAGLAFAVGMLVDNAIVVLENIYRHNQILKKPPLQAAIDGTNEVWGAVLASTLTTLAVFLPVLFVQQEAGQLFRDIAIAISAAVGLSMIVSITLIPTATARLLTTKNEMTLGLESDTMPEKQTTTSGWLVGFIAGIGTLFLSLVERCNYLIQRSIVLKLIVASTVTAAAFGLSWLMWPKVEYLPSGNRNLVFANILPPPGYSTEQLLELGAGVEAALEPYWNTNPDDPKAAELPHPTISDFFYSARGRSIFIGLRAHDPERAAEIVPMIREFKDSIPGALVTGRQSSLFERGGAGGRSVDVEITGPEIEQLVKIGGAILRRTKEIFPTAQARPIPSLDLSSPEVHVVPKLIQSRDLGLDASMIGYAVNAMVDGAYATDYYLGGDKIDVTLMASDQVVRHSQDLEALPIATPSGQLVPLSTVASIRMSSGPEQINHRERQRAITIEISPPEDIALQDALEVIQNDIIRPLQEQGEFDGGYRATLSGAADKLRDTWDALRWNVVLALLITYLLMAALFESWSYPLVIMFSVPLGAVGGLLGLKLLGYYLVWGGQTPQQLDVITMLGFVVLIGTVVNNPILIVHQALGLMKEGKLSREDAIVESVTSRIRPIFMTTTTTVLGLLPLVLFPGAGSELYRGLGSVLLGGLLVSTLVTLVYVPTLFALTMDLADLVRKFVGPKNVAPAS
jgi:hydrophobic/amphiphilic exporter-1 (mainly G- bacteria), HAE1 family